MEITKVRALLNELESQIERQRERVQQIEADCEEMRQQCIEKVVLNRAVQMTEEMNLPQYAADIDKYKQRYVVFQQKAHAQQEKLKRLLGIQEAWETEIPELVLNEVFGFE